jgi:hypothetical protein
MTKNPDKKELPNSTNFFRPRDIGCNRYPIYDENGKYLTDGLKSGFEFTDFADLKQKLVELLELKVYDHLYITKDGGVINGLCIGYVDALNNIEDT